MKIEDVARALAADREKLIALGGDPGPTEAELFSNGVMDLNSALALAEDMTDAPGYGDMQDALVVLAAAYRKAEERIADLLTAGDTKTAVNALPRLLAERRVLREREERLREENASLRAAWADIHNFLRHTWSAAVNDATETLFKSMSASTLLRDPRAALKDNAR